MAYAVPWNGSASTEVIISRTPLRISLFGGGTDYPAYFQRFGGETLACTIDKYLTVSVHPLTEFFDHILQIHYSRVESVKSLDDISIGVVRETLRYMGYSRGLEIHLASDLPARTGLGSSSATTVGLLTALHSYRGEYPAREHIAAEAVHVEQVLLAEPVGCQDQYATACGGLRWFSFATDGRVRSRTLAVSQERLLELHSALLLFYTGQQRDANRILGAQVQSMTAGKLDAELHRIRSHVARAVEVLEGSGSLEPLGELLHETWQAKRSLSPQVSTPSIDSRYERARQAGALGGKLLGAGSGGFLLLFVPVLRQEEVRAVLEDMSEVRFAFDDRGTRIVYKGD
jgi:D-glycero-alpha-D-manno-heptose-7-phosphate kinase